MKEYISFVNNLFEDEVILIEKTDVAKVRILALNMLWSALLFLISMIA